MKAKRGIIIVSAAVAVLAVCLGVLSYVSYAKGLREFIADGFILKPSQEVNISSDVNEQYYFSQGSKYKEKYGTKVLFKDTAGDDVALSSEQFVHYADGSLGSFTKGVIMDVTDLDAEQYGYYNLTKNTILIKNGSTYEMSSRGEAMSIDEYIWKISDTDYMLVSSEITLTLGNSDEITLPDYAQIKYVDNGIVRIIHQQGTYQTISADSFLTTAGGAELNLTGKSFYVQGKPAIHLDKISLQDDSYIDLDENADSDTPQFKIPTFNVVNGKNGASGANGTSGTDGSSGEDGADGGEGGGGGGGGDGGEGAEGMGGNSGGSGGRGTDGSDGLEGDSGIMGYDGKNGADGTDGESGKREDEMSGVVAAEIFTRPTVNMETDGYKVTPNGVEMHLNLTDLDNSLVQGKTTVTIYDRETMKPVASLPSWGEDLYNSGSVVVNTSNLAPDREYILIVAGEYYAEGDDTEGREANLFTKIFRTNSLGVTLEKGNVTDSSVLVRTRKVGSDVNTFGVELYYYDDNHNKIPMGTYTGLTSGGDLIFELDKPINTPEVKSNTLYYAALCNIELSGVSSAVSTEGTEIELRTLKKKPYKKEGGGAIASLQPVLSVNNKSHTATLSLQDEIADIDNGITGFRYELYRATEVLDAKTKNDLSGLIPAYVVEVPNAKDQVFQLDPNDKDANNIPTEYIGRVVVLFNDNEKDNEYNTDFSKSARLEDSTFPLIEFVNVQKVNGSYHDSINGYVKVTDLSSLLTPFLGEDAPMIMTITSEFEDVYTLKLFTPESPNSNLYYFEQDGLRKSTAYSLSVSGPVDTDQSGPPLSAAEKLTYLAGTRVTTPTTKAFKLVASKEPDSTVAFSWRVNLAAGEDGALSRDDQKFYEHEAKTMEELELRLYRRTIIGGEEKEEQVGNAYVVKDQWTKEFYDLNTSDLLRKNWKFKSDFEGAYLEDNEVKTGNITYENVADPSTANGIVKGYTTNTPKTEMDSKMIVTPKEFARAENDSIFSSGDTFIIRAITTGDYTSHGTSNNIGFTDTGCQFEFKMEKTHIQASNPNTQVQVSGLIKNSEAKEHGDGNGGTITKDNNLDDDTVVGMRFQAAYPYSDALTVTYRIYELDNTVASPDASATSQNVYFKMNTSTVTEDWSTAYSDADCTAGNEIAKLVETIAVTDLQGRTSAGEAPEITLYFSDPENPKTTGNVGNIAAALEAGQSLKRGARYFIAYTVMTAWEGGYTCGGSGTVDHAYPNCAYKIKDPTNPEHVPFYRSEVVEISKQKPRVQRYPWTSTSSDVEWKYRIIDPDATILKVDGSSDAKFDFILKAASTTAALATASETKLPENVDDYIVKKATDLISGTSEYFNVKSFTVSDNYYYQVTLKYKALDYVNEVPVEIPSIPIYKQAAPTNMVATTSTDVNGVKLQGRLATSGVTPPGNIVGGASGTIEKAIVNQGGYRYRITLQGNNIDKIAALRVTFKDANSISTPEVVYDPVYLNIGTATGTEQKWAYAYVDASALKKIKDAPYNATDVNVTVEAYYSDGTSGLKDYNDTLHNTYTVGEATSFAGDQVYAMRWLKPDGTYAYRTMRIDPNDSTKTKVNFLEADTDTANGSVFLPFDNAGNKFEEGAAAEKASMGIRRPEQAMSLSDALSLDRFASTQMTFTYDENGIRSEIGDYITLEKLAGPVKLNLVTTGDSATVNLLDLFPAIQEQKTETGSTGLYVQFKAIGSGAAPGVKLYARIAEQQKDANGKPFVPERYRWLKLARHDEIPGLGQQYKEYYEPIAVDEANGRYDTESVEPLDAGSYYAWGNGFQTGAGSDNGVSGIELQQDTSGNYYYPLRIKGLRSDTKYNIVVYAYDSSPSHEIVDLFSLDGQTTGYAYNKTTANLTKIKLNKNVAYTYTDYNNKYGTAFFNMSDGETGTGIWIYYTLEDMKTGQKLVDMQLVNPTPAVSGGHTLYYYDQNDNAHSIKMDMHPAGSPTATNPLVLENPYRLTIVIKDTLGNGDGKTPENAGSLSDNSSDYVLEFTPKGYNNTNKLAPAYLGLTLKKGTDSASKPQINAEVVITDSQRSVKDFTIELYDETGMKVATQAFPVENLTTPIVQTVTFSSTGAYTIEEGKDYTVKVIANRDADNDGTVEDASKVEKEKTISINDKLDANVSWSINANTKLLTLKLSDLNGFSSVNKIMYTIYYKPSASGSATPIGTGTQEVTAGQSGYTLTYNGWSDGYPKDGYYTFELQFYNGTTRLGNKDVSDQEWKASTGLGLFKRNADDADAAEDDEAGDGEAVEADSAEDADADVSEAETPAETAAPAETVTGSETAPTQTEDTAPAAEEAAAGEIDAAVTEP